MLIYWLLLGYFVAGTAISSPSRSVRELSPMLVLGALLIAFLIGFRFEVGGDWVSYELMFNYLGRVDLERALEVGDPGYQLLNWIVQQLGGDIWLVNFVGGLVFSWGLLRFATSQPIPWLAFVVAVPYLVVVVGMGYTRQAIAIGILMAGLASTNRSESSVLRFAAYVAVAALFHRTAVIAFPLVALAARRNLLLNVLLVAAFTYFFYGLFLGDEMARFVSNYIKTEYSSQGAAIRIVMNLVPAFVFLAFRHRLGFSQNEYPIWRNFSLAAVALSVLLLVLPSSTAVDRVALYIIPLQVAVLSRVPGNLIGSGTGKLAMSFYSALVLFVWLTFATHAEYWVPYKIYPLWD